MRVGLCDTFQLTYPKFRWVEQGFNALGHETIRLRNPAELAEAECDWVLFSQNIPVASDELYEIAESKSCPWAIWIFDLLGYGIGDMLLQTTEWGLFEAAFCKNPVALVGTGVPQAHWLDQGSPPWSTPPKNREYDVLIPGSWRPGRQEIATRLKDAGFDPVTAGRGWNRTSFRWLGNQFTDEQMFRLFSCAKVVVCDNFAQIPFYWSDRIWLALAGGASYVGPQVDGLMSTPAVWLWDDIDKMTTFVEHAVRIHPYDHAIQMSERNCYRNRVGQLIQRMVATCLL